MVGRLSKDDIERMVHDAEKYKNDDEQQRERIQAKNALESYAYNMKSTAEDDKLKDKLSEEDRRDHRQVQWGHLLARQQPGN